MRHALETRMQVCETLGGLGREELKGEVVCVWRQSRNLVVDPIHCRDCIVFAAEYRNRRVGFLRPEVVSRTLNDT